MKFELNIEIRLDRIHLYVILTHVEYVLVAFITSSVTALWITAKRFDTNTNDEQLSRTGKLNLYWPSSCLWPLFNKPSTSQSLIVREWQRFPSDPSRIDSVRFFFACASERNLSTRRNRKKSHSRPSQSVSIIWWIELCNYIIAVHNYEYKMPSHCCRFFNKVLCLRNYRSSESRRSTLALVRFVTLVHAAWWLKIITSIQPLSHGGFV